MAQLVVEVLEANDLMPKDGQGSASPFVEVDFDHQRQRTSTKPKDLNPQWAQKLVFNLSGPHHLRSKTIEVIVYNDRKAASSSVAAADAGGHHKNFLSRIRIFGDSVLLSESEATI